MPDSPVIPDLVTHLECGLCSRKYPAGQIAGLCSCGGPLLVRYDLPRLKAAWPRKRVADGPDSMWRYAPALPVQKTESVISLGEGMTPLLRLRRIGAGNILLKDDGLNPAGSSKARGLSCAVSMGVELGVRKLAIASAGNAASALAAYAAAAGLEAHIFMPQDVPPVNYLECKSYGAKVTLVDGPIGDCSRMVAERGAGEGWFDVSALKEPYRMEGCKTMGYELAEQLGWELPEAIFYPADGTGITGMWKAFAEMEAFGWTGPKSPKMIAVQAEGPQSPGDFLLPNAVRESGGTAVAVSHRELIDAGIRLATEEGIFAAPEGAACIVAAERLVENGFLKATDRIVICNTGSGLKYPEAYSTRFPRMAAGETDKLGGLITPR